MNLSQIRRFSNFYPRSPRGERPARERGPKAKDHISIHVPREGNDWPFGPPAGRWRTFLSTFPARGTTLHSSAFATTYSAFLSTFPARGTTRVARCRYQRGVYFYPRSPRGERPSASPRFHDSANISIHVPREGNDDPRHFSVDGQRSFLSTFPARGTTACPQPRIPWQSYFYPRSPRGERPAIPLVMIEPGNISIHVPREGNDGRTQSHRLRHRISIHVPREGNDPRHCCHPPIAGQFLSTFPARGTTGCDDSAKSFLDISIHVPREGNDEDINSITPEQVISIHVPREGNDDPRHFSVDGQRSFLSTFPARGTT